jgi:hypothetical protein
MVIAGISLVGCRSSDTPDPPATLGELRLRLAEEGFECEAPVMPDLHRRFPARVPQRTFNCEDESGNEVRGEWMVSAGSRAAWSNGLKAASCKLSREGIGSPISRLLHVEGPQWILTPQPSFNGGDTAYWKAASALNRRLAAFTGGEVVNQPPCA